ncbi:MAG: peptidylprolyl isomerase [Dysgonamonadaceae bacterium]|jgi:peptidyl-prolyl cis-trans isomerase SurA|nr:peptidylprolyl isomerase [Dysgonamonadaceae bacterium]
MKKFLFVCLLVLKGFLFIQAQENIVDRVIWIVGDDAILLSDVEYMRLQMQASRQEIPGDPYCKIPEQIALQKLFLHQAKIDSIDVPDSNVFQYAEQTLNQHIKNAGSQEKLEEWLGITINQYREDLRVSTKEHFLAQQMKSELVKNVKITPSEVRTFFKRIPQDSLPYIPTTVEVEILTVEPQVSLEEIDDIKRRLREYTEQITKGEKQFASIARLYSEDKGSAPYGGELGFKGKGQLTPEFAISAFDLNDPKRISRIVETEYGYHIIQLIEKRGDRINCRHILLKPYVSPEELEEAKLKLDTMRNSIVRNEFSFEEAVGYYSHDKDTRNNKGLMVNNPRDESMMSERAGTSRFEMDELPPEIAKTIDTMKINDVSQPFILLNDKGKEVAAIVKLKLRIPGHKASLTDDFHALKSMVEYEKQEQVISEWIKRKIKETYIRINDNWKNCDFEYDGWVQNKY